MKAFNSKITAFVHCTFAGAFIYDIGRSGNMDLFFEYNCLTLYFSNRSHLNSHRNFFSSNGERRVPVLKDQCIQSSIITYYYILGST